MTQPNCDQIDAFVTVFNYLGLKVKGVVDDLLGDGFQQQASSSWWKSVDQFTMNVGDPQEGFLVLKLRFLRFIKKRLKSKLS